MSFGELAASARIWSPLAFGQTLFEFAHAFAEVAHRVRNFAAPPEQKQGDRAQDQEIPDAECAHDKGKAGAKALIFLRFVRWPPFDASIIVTVIKIGAPKAIYCN
ncbi:MAG TPA: hypothetical protein VJ750_00830 [Rhizomicrobium sp.]|nr:hypothetical protein [Rhizomicrobium sp.]